MALKGFPQSPNELQIILGTAWNGSLGNRLGGPGTGGIDSNGEDNGVINLKQVGSTGKYTETGDEIVNATTNRIRLVFSDGGGSGSFDVSPLNSINTKFYGGPYGPLDLVQFGGLGTYYTFKEIFSGTPNYFSGGSQIQAASFSAIYPINLAQWKSGIISSMSIYEPPQPTLQNKTTYVFK